MGHPGVSIHFNTISESQKEEGWCWGPSLEDSTSFPLTKLVANSCNDIPLGKHDASSRFSSISGL